MEYSVEKKHGCTIVYGSVPIQAMIELMKSAGDQGQVDSSLAHKIGANMIIGTPEDLEKLQQDPEIIHRIQKNVAAMTTGGSLPPGAIAWLEVGEHGSSSKAIFYQMTRRPQFEKDRYMYPRDPTDLRRCRLLLEQVPEFASRLGEMKNVSTQWAALVEQWDTLCQQMDQEAPDWRDAKGGAKGTYQRMKEILGEGQVVFMSR